MDKKTCNKCKKEKCLSDFNKNKSKPDGHSYTCRSCMKKYMEIHYKNNKNYYLEKNRKQLEILKTYIFNIKKDSSCERCGETHPATLDFHHIDPKTKKFAIAEIYVVKPSVKRLQREINKCEIICSNCHRKEHYKEIIGA